MSDAQVKTLVDGSFCGTMRDKRATCDGWDIGPNGASKCKFLHTDKCPLPRTEEERARERADYLEEVGFGRRYQSPAVEKLFGGVPEADLCARRLADYWLHIDEHLRAGTGFLLCGTVGTGKTFALTLTALAAQTSGYRVRYIYAPDLFGLLHSRDEQVALYERCGLLLLDDFGAQYATEWHTSAFNALIESRHSNQRATCITTNLSPQALDREKAFERSVDRWRESCEGHILVLGFDSLRSGQEAAA